MLMAYTKTQWNENTPITADRLNNIETGVENAIDKTATIMEIPITNSYGWQQFRWNRPNCDTVSWTRDADKGKAIEIFNETDSKQLLLLDDNGNLTAAGNLVVQGTTQLNGHVSTGDMNIYGSLGVRDGVDINGKLKVGKNVQAANFAIDTLEDTVYMHFRYNGSQRGLIRAMSDGSGVELHSYDGNGTWKNNFVLSAETGKALVNGRRLAAFDTSNPAHCVFRYGSGLGGAAGYITFSY